MVTKRIDLPSSAVEMYLSGASVAKVAAAYGVAPGVITRHVLETGARMRSSTRGFAPDPQDVLDRHARGDTIRAIVEATGVKMQAVFNTLERAGATAHPAGPRTAAIPDELVRRYVAGESAARLGVEFGVPQTAIRIRLRAEGIPVRPGHTYKRDGVSAAMTRERRARSGARLSFSSHYEDDLASVLDSIGVPYVRQKAVGKYSVDFALPDRMLALEVLGGWNTKERIEHLATRRSFIEAAGWKYAEIAPPFDHLRHFAGHL